MSQKTLGIIGCGNIGATLARAADKDLADKISRIILWDIDPQKTALLKKELSNAEAASGADEVIDAADLIVEAAAPSVVEGLLEKAVEKRKDIMIMSIGGVLGNAELLKDARKQGIRVMLPSGAISGIDALKAAKVAGIDSVTITTRKPPISLKGAPYLADKGIEIDKIKGETVIFEGSAADAIKAFPKNINVSVLLSLAGIGAQKTRVRIITSPEYTRNTHEVEVKGRSGVITARTENVPSPQNPKTSYLAVLSAIAALSEYFDTVRIGT